MAIRFVNFGRQIFPCLDKEFGFYDTITDRFIVKNCQVCWETWDDFECSYNLDKEEFESVSENPPYRCVHYPLYRFKEVCHQWVFKKEYLIINKRYKFMISEKNPFVLVDKLEKFKSLWIQERKKCNDEVEKLNIAESFIFLCREFNSLKEEMYYLRNKFNIFIGFVGILSAVTITDVLVYIFLK